MIDIYAYEHFSFDLWMTIIKSNPEFKPKRTILFKEYFSIDKSVEEIDKTIRYYDNLYNLISEKTGNHIEREEIFLLILNVLGKNVELINSEDIDDFFIKSDILFLENRPQIIWKEIPSILEKITDLGKTANILSNTAFIHGNSLREVLKSLNLEQYFTFMIFSDEVGVSKPNIKIFEYLYENTQKIKQLEKSKIIHVGDNIKADYEGALKFGFDAKLVKFI
ncbi:MAG: HAD family hydrolase [Bacilli bacterium]|uniref:HAD family hydrolase n=1 Tax=Algoriella sp. TaxID=1872434 RepID=UPI002FC5B85A